MNLIMPEKGGAEAVAEIMGQAPETRIIVLTTFGTVDDMAIAIKFGAIGALLKPQTKMSSYPQSVLLPTTDTQSPPRYSNLCRKTFPYRNLRHANWRC